MDQYRTFDGSNNNQQHPEWGKANEPLLRNTTVGYDNGVDSPAGRGGVNPREISNKVCKQNNPNPNRNNLSDFTWAWGQFLDHEIDLTEFAEPDEHLDIEVSHGDPDLPRGGLIEFKRSEWHSSTGTGPDNPRQQLNRLSSYIDGANVYGASEERASALRMIDGTGRLKVSKGPRDDDLLPFNVDGLPNATPEGANPADFFVAGDIRANEHAVLTCMHTLFAREHNRLCAEIVDKYPGLSGDDEAIFQMARKIVGGIMQAITFNDFLPALLGDNAIPPYGGYDDNVNATIANLFSTACYRVGHTMLPPDVMLGGSGSERLALRNAFFTPRLVIERGIEPFLAGLRRQRMQEIDTEIVEDVRSFLFGPPDPRRQRLLDLAALNIQRGRDHGLPDYNRCRLDYGLEAKKGFDDITSNPKIRNKLRQVYGDIDNVDPWIGALAEDHVSDAEVGELIYTVLKDQFERLRHGDRFWFENDPVLSEDWKAAIRTTRLSDVIRRNTNLIDLPDRVFRVSPPTAQMKGAADKA